MDGAEFVRRLAAGLAADAVRGVIRRLDRPRLPRLDGTFQVRGLDGRVEVIRDRWGVPHVYAGSTRDVFFAQGFVHAQDRFCQMELDRRFGHGRVAEVFGPTALPLDRAARVLGFGRTAAIDLEAADDALRAALDAYSDGVNAWIRSPWYRAPVELALVGAPRPAPWTPLDSLVFGRMMYWQLCRGWASEVVRARLIEAVGPERAAELEIVHDPRNPVTLPRGIEVADLDPADVLPRGPLRDRGMGSNAWALSGARTASGRPLLANDMHLPLMLPSFWYEIHLVGGGLEVSGVSLPGLPMVMAGHNARIAWGMTLAHTDAEDTYVERFDPRSPHRYEFQGAWREADVRVEEIRVRGRRRPERVEVVTTVHGPIVSDALPGVGRRLALRSTALDPAQSALGWLRLNTARGWDDFVAAMRVMETPPLNVAYADVDGNIGYWCCGKVPIRASGDGRVPACGHSGDAEWVGYVPFDEMPHARNPAQGYVVSCNQPVVPPDYPHWMGGVFVNGARARRIVQAIEAGGRMTVEDCRALQADVTCLPAADLIARLRRVRSDDPDFRLVSAILDGWVGRLDPRSVGACVYEVLRFRLARRLLEPALGPDLADRLMGRGFDPTVSLSNEFYGHDSATILRMLDRPKSWWVRTAGGRDAWVVGACRDATAYLRERLGPAPERWEWGRIHGAVFAHPMGTQPPLDRVFNLGPLPIGGDTDTPNQTAMCPDDPYDVKAWAATFRQILDTADWSRSLIIHAPGQSGQPASPHAEDLLDTWMRCELHPMLWTRADVEAHAAHRLTLA